MVYNDTQLLIFENVFLIPFNVASIPQHFPFNKREQQKGDKLCMQEVGKMQVFEDPNPNHATSMVAQLEHPRTYALLRAG